MENQPEAKPDLETKAKEQHTFTKQSNQQRKQGKKQKSNKKSKSKSNNESDQQNEDLSQKSDINQDSKQGEDDELLQQINPNQRIQEGEAFMLPQEREIDKKHPKYHFCRFLSRHYRLIEDKKDRKNHFVRMQPVFVRFLHVLKLHNLPLITIDTFRKYFKKFFKRRGIKYEQTTNRVDMKVVVGIDRRYNSKFQF